VIHRIDNIGPSTPSTDGRTIRERAHADAHKVVPREEAHPDDEPEDGNPGTYDRRGHRDDEDPPAATPHIDAVA
jgi:hypothetical protein